jgi:aminoglycoside phosphotransferase (APT) family kinase protein
VADDPVPARPPEWTAEHVVTARDAAVLIGRQFPALRGVPVEPLATGWDNTVHLVDDRWVFRFPRRAIALPGVRREIAVLTRLAGRLPLAIPVPEFVGRPSESYPWPFFGARLVPGRELAEAALADPDRERAAVVVGEFLRALHDPSLVADAAPTLPIDPMRRGDPAVRAAKARERLTTLIRSGLWQPDSAIDRLLAEADRLGKPARDPAGPILDPILDPILGPVVVHGDLHARHLLVGDDGRATGVIDWGDVCLADPGVDLSLAYGAFTGPARAALLAAYGPVDPDREVRARVLAVFLCAALADYAAKDNRPHLLRESLVGLRRATSD